MIPFGVELCLTGRNALLKVSVTATVYAAVQRIVLVKKANTATSVIEYIGES